MKKIFTLLLLLAGLSSVAQYNNEWIQFNQNYYKFKIAQPGLYRIPKSVLDAAGIGSAGVEFFELWRNGERVPIYTPVTSGALPGGGYIEFWGQPNDGKPDRVMYRDPAFQLTDRVSLQTDSSTYFLSVNTNQSGFRYTDVANNVAANVLPVEPYLMYTYPFVFRYKINYGFAAVVGEYVYSSSYDKGEVWASAEFKPAQPMPTNTPSLYTYTGGPESSLKFGASGNALNPRTVSVQIGSTTLIDTLMDYFNDMNAIVPVPTSILGAGPVTVTFNNNSGISTDRMIASYFELTYPRQFNFDNQKYFDFVLPAKPAGYFLNITNFNYGSSAPVLYDRATGERYTGDISVPGTVKFAITGSAVDRKLVLVNTEAANIASVSNMTPRTFERFTDVANQGDYLIITSPLLYTGSAGNNPINDYKAYRESTNGGGHKVQIVDVDQLVDQFGFGIKKHPLSVKNFLRYARANFAQPLNYVFLIGRGMTYTEYQSHQSDPLADQLNIVPSFGYPASDNLLSSGDVANPVPVTPIGRLSVVKGSEIENYLDKVKEYETAQRTLPSTLTSRDWMKNVVHVTGSSDPYLGTVLCNFMGTYRDIIQDSVFGGKVTTFCKQSTNPVELLSSEKLADLFAEGITMLTYFGHSSSTTLEFNIDDPQAYNNPGKYPVFFVNGCNAGNFFTFNSQRLIVNETLSEKFVLAKNRGSIAFVASTHYGIVNYLNVYLTGLYETIGRTDFNKSLGQIQKDALQALEDATGPYDYYSRLHAEEITLHGDPGLYLNSQPKADYTIEEPLIKLNPAFISLAEDGFDVKIKMINLGRAYNDSIRVEIKQTYPDGSTGIIFNQKILGIRYADSITLHVKIINTRDKGLNKITVTLDPDNAVDEINEGNNTATKEFYIYEDEARPAFPYNYAIISDPNQKLYASTADPFTAAKTYRMEIDTSRDFNSSIKVTKNVNSAGGVMEFDPGFAYTDSTVYYWRVSLIPANGIDFHWLGSSFFYVNGSVDGYGQSHFFQHEESTTDHISITAARKWEFGHTAHNLFIKNAVFPTGAGEQAAFTIALDGNPLIGPGCNYNELVFNVIDPITFQPWANNFSGPTGLYGSYKSNCGSQRLYGFCFMTTSATTRKAAMDFMDFVPPGNIIIVRTNVSPTGPGYPNNVYVDQWKADTLLYGTNNSLFHKLFYAGLYELDSFHIPRTFSFVYKKGDTTFVPDYQFSVGATDRINLPVSVLTKDTIGHIVSPKFGPAKAWHEVHWDGYSTESPLPSADNPSIDVVGVDNNNVETILYKLDKNTHIFDLSAVDPVNYPYMRLKMRNVDSINLTPYQLKYWRIHYDPIPEGAIAANLYYTGPDTVDAGQIINFGVAFKNISKAPFDSIAVKINVLDRGNATHSFNPPKLKPIVGGDTTAIRFSLDTKDYPGMNTLYVDVNPDNLQPEHYHFNNFLYRNFYVRVDKINPLLDVTFDGIHILNRDIVSPRPHIQIKLKDESKYLLLNDTAISSVQIKGPDGTRTYNFDNDTLRFTPATSSSDNTAVIDFSPAFTKQVKPDGDDYELIVKGKDASGNKAGDNDYHVSFRVINKPMISNLLNYPNPFSTSTAFVFTLTGSEIPQNMRIQILTVTGKIVREITMNELGPIRIGRNITEFKWDGTDQYGQKLANGVYLYHVVTSLNGKAMDKFKSEDDNTDKFFTNGYGKMYLMR